jgi:hypothetical protein
MRVWKIVHITIDQAMSPSNQYATTVGQTIIIIVYHITKVTFPATCEGAPSTRPAEL